MVMRGLARMTLIPAFAVLVMIASAAPAASQGVDSTAEHGGSAALTAAEDAAVTVTALKHVGMRDAALLMSGQQGGGINGVLMVGTPYEAGSRVVPFWIELAIHPPAASTEHEPWALEAFAYSLDEHLEVEYFEGRRVAFDPGSINRSSGGGIKISGSIGVSEATRSLRVLVRNSDGGDFFLDAKVVPGPTGGTELAEASVIFPDAGEGWIHVDADASETAEESNTGNEIAGNVRVPHGRPVVLAPSAVAFFVVVPGGGEEISSIRGRLHGHRGRELDGGLLVVGDRLEVSNHDFAAYSVAWNVPALDADQYVLELELAHESGVAFATEITVVGVPPEIAPIHPTWVAYAGGSARPSAPTASAGQLAYADALRLCISDRWNDGVSAVFGLEQRTDRRMGGTEFSADLRNLEASIIKDLSEHTPEAMIPLLVLHYDVFELWIRADDPVGRKHSIELIAAMVNNVRKKDALAPAVATAVGVLASMGDTLHQIGASENASLLLELALALDPTTEAPRIGVALDHEWLGHYVETVEILEDLAGRPDALYEGRLRLAVNLLRTGKTRDAVTEFRACTSSDAPSWVRVVAYEELALHFLDEGRPDQARDLIDAAIGVFPRETTLRLVSAAIEENRGNLGGARQIFADLDRQTVSTYRESPRKRYARWPSELFAEIRRATQATAEDHLDDLESAMSSQTNLRSK